MMFFITAFMCTIYLYITWRGLLPMTAPLWMKIIILLLLLPGVLDIVVTLRWGARMPPCMIYLFSGSALALIYLGIGTLLLDLSRWLYRPLPGLADGIVILCLFLAFFATWNASRLPIIHELTVHSPDLPKNWQNLKIVQLTDLHIGQGFTKEYLEQVVQKTNALNPDVIFITGDSVDQHTKILADDMRALQNLQAPTYMVFGNHEYYHGPEAWRQIFQKMGIRVLYNQAITLENRGQKYVVGGADFGGWMHKDKIASTLDQTFSETDEKLPRLLLVHYPIVFDEAVKKGVLLQLSGHTHGGMTPPISWATALFNGGYVRGLYQKGKAFLYVSDGTGLWTGMPARLGSSNEIVVINWVKE